MPASQTIRMPDVNWLYECPPQIDTTPTPSQPNSLAFQPDDYDSVMDAFGQRWRVVDSPLLAKVSEAVCLTIPSQKAIVRLRNNSILGVVSSKTNVVRHLEFFQQLQSHLGTDKILVQDAGQIYGGRIVSVRGQAATP